MEYLTEDGKKILKTRLKTIIRLFNENVFPLDLVMFGFPKLQIEDREEAFGRIKELSDVTQTQIKMFKIQNEKGVDYKIE